MSYDPTGAQGPTGATGPITLNPSSYFGSGDLNILLSNNGTTGGTGGTSLGSTTITLLQQSYIMATAVANFRNTSNDDEIVNMYVVLNGTTSNVTRNSIVRQQGGDPGYVPITILQRTNTSIPSGNYSCQVFAYTTTSSTNVICDHLDIGLIGNLN